jgi:hypothetical protein
MMETEAIISPTLEITFFVSGMATPSDYHLNFSSRGELVVRFLQFFKDLPQHVERWLHALLSRWRALIVGAIFFLLGLVFSGIVEGAVFDYWKGSVQPWLAKSYSISLALLIVISLGWLLLILACIFLAGVYGADKRRIGQLQKLEQKNETREQAALELTGQITQLTEQQTQLTGRIAQREDQLSQLVLEIDKLRKEIKYLT